MYDPLALLEEDLGEEFSSEDESPAKKPKLTMTELKAHGYKDLNEEIEKQSRTTTAAVVAAPAVSRTPITPESSDKPKRTHKAASPPHNPLGNPNEKAENPEDKAKSFRQKEKRKRDLGQASRGKSYNEEEKRILRESFSMPSGFDT